MGHKHAQRYATPLTTGEKWGPQGVPANPHQTENETEKLHRSK